MGCEKNCGCPQASRNSGDELKGPVRCSLLRALNIEGRPAEGGNWPALRDAAFVPHARVRRNQYWSHLRSYVVRWLDQVGRCSVGTHYTNTGSGVMLSKHGKGRGTLWGYANHPMFLCDSSSRFLTFTCFSLTIFHSVASKKVNNNRFPFN